MLKMVFYNLLHRMVMEENYSTKEEMQAKIDNFFNKGRITETQKVELERLLSAPGEKAEAK